MMEIAEDLGLADDTVSAIEAAAEEQKAEEAKIAGEQLVEWKKLNTLLDEGVPSEEALIEVSRAVGVDGLRAEHVGLAILELLLVDLVSLEVQRIETLGKFLDHGQVSGQHLEDL